MEGFEAEWKPEIGQYSKKFVEYCSIKALTNMCQSIEEKISDGSFSRLTFDMMLAWEMPSAADEESHTVSNHHNTDILYLFHGPPNHYDIIPILVCLSAFQVASSISFSLYILWFSSVFAPIKRSMNSFTYLLNLF